MLLAVLWPPSGSRVFTSRLFVLHASSVPLSGRFCLGSDRLSPWRNVSQASDRICQLCPVAYSLSRCWSMCSDHCSSLIPADARKKIWQHVGLFRSAPHTQMRLEIVGEQRNFSFLSFQSLFSHIYLLPCYPLKCFKYMSESVPTYNFRNIFLIYTLETKSLTYKTHQRNGINLLRRNLSVLCKVLVHTAQ